MIRLLARPLASLGAGLFALLALLSGFDRLDTYQPDDAWLIAGDLHLAREAARHSIATDPLDPQGAALLGAAAYVQGRDEEGRQAMHVAARLSPREPLSQSALTVIAMEEGRAQDAARHFDILLRVHPEARMFERLFTILESSPAGQAELARRLAMQSVWTDAYLRAEGQDIEVLRTRARFLTDNGKALTLGCARIDPMVRELARRNFRADAQALQAAQCMKAGRNQLVADPDFEHIGDDPTFGWRRHTSGDVRISLTEGASGTVEIFNRGSVTRLVLSQALALKPGEYRVFADISCVGQVHLMASLNCGQAEQPSGQSRSLIQGQLLHSTGCDDLVLGIWLKPGEGSVTIDNIRLVSIDR